MTFVTKVILLALLTVVSGQSRFKLLEFECLKELGVDHPCLRACQFEKLGVLEDGKFNYQRALMRIEYNRMANPERMFTLKRAMKTCYREVSPYQNNNQCLMSTTMYYCIHSKMLESKLNPNIPNPGIRVPETNVDGNPALQGIQMPYRQVMMPEQVPLCAKPQQVPYQRVMNPFQGQRIDY